MFIALDIETTGFDPLLDEVIEIAAVRFDRDKVLGTFQTLLNPRREIPRIVEHITGITGADLEKAPLIEEIGESFIEFVGDLPIVGHNINFDVNFLNQKGFNFKNPRYDTLDLASLLLPGLPSYSLDTLTRLLHIEHTEKHRALSDTKASQELFSYLLKKIDELDESTLRLLQIVLDKSQWECKVLFQEAYKKLQIDSVNTPNFSKPLDEFSKNAATVDFTLLTSEPTAFSAEEFIAKLQAQSEAANAIPFLEKLLHSAKAQQPFLCEHPSTLDRKKSYLLAGWFLRRFANKTLVIATTEPLTTFEHQLSPEFLAFLESLSSQPLSIAFLKNPSNYLSIDKLKSFIDRAFFEDYETTFLLKILLWLQRTKTGDLNELNLQGKEFSLREDLCCPQKATDSLGITHEPFWQRALGNAHKSDILIVSFDFLLQKTVQQGDLLPSDSLIVFDDAADLEQITTQFFSLHLGLSSFIKPFEKLLRKIEIKPETDDTHTSDLPAADATDTIDGSNTIDAADNPSQLEGMTAEKLLQYLINRTEIFFGLLGIMAERKNEYQEEMGFSPAILEAADEERLEWKKLKASAEFLCILIDKLLETEICQGYQEVLQERKDLLTAIFHLGPTEDDAWGIQRVSWLAKTIEGNAYLRSCPREVGPLLQQYFFNKGQPLALVSSCIKVKNSFAFLRQQLGVTENFGECSFSFNVEKPENFALIVPHDIPKPSKEEHFLAAAQIIKDAVLHYQGKTIVLFSSKRSLTGTCLQLTPELRNRGYDILAQGVTGGQGKITEYYKQEKDKVALFTTPDFWQQLKISPKDISCLIIHKLPFDSPNDPLLKQRSQKFLDPFQEYLIPRAVMLLKKTVQHFFQQRTTPATILLLDNRILNTGYGKAFLESFPENLPRKTCTQQEVKLLLKSFY